MGQVLKLNAVAHEIYVGEFQKSCVHPNDIKIIKHLIFAKWFHRFMFCSFLHWSIMGYLYFNRAASWQRNNTVQILTISVLIPKTIQQIILIAEQLMWISQRTLLERLHLLLYNAVSRSEWTNQLYSFGMISHRSLMETKEIVANQRTSSKSLSGQKLFFYHKVFVSSISHFSTKNDLSKYRIQ